jgi:aspartyl protease family protein
MIWLAVIGLIAGLTAFYQALIRDDGAGMVAKVGEDGRLAVILQSDRSGHYLAEGEVNGRAVHFLVDTGATDVAVSERLARGLGLKFGPRITVMTAAGPASAWRARLDRVSIGGLERENVRATITPGLGSQALLGMSFLKHFSIRQEEGRLVIEN